MNVTELKVVSQPKEISFAPGTKIYRPPNTVKQIYRQSLLPDHQGAHHSLILMA